MAKPTQGTIAQRNEACVVAMEAIAARVAGKAPAPGKRTLWKPSKILAEISVYDHHFGKLAWAPETGTNYDLAIAESLYENAVLDLLDRVRGYKPEEFVLTVGQDLFHIDNVQYQTTNGTPQDTDGRLSKIIETVERSLFRAVGLLSARGRVRVIWVKGNHDALTSQFMARIIAAEFRKDERVTVDVSPTARKYIKYGVNLLGYVHGNGIPARDLPLLMARECPNDWAACTTREWHTGHLHQERVTEKMGVRVRIMPSLCGTDAWHSEAGYAGNRRAAEAYLYGFTEGYIGHFQVDARE